MNLNDRQMEIAMRVREMAKTPEDDSWGPFTDFTRTISTMIEGAESLVPPPEMQKRFGTAWSDYASIWMANNPSK